MGLRSIYKTDPSAAQSGVWFDLPNAKNKDGTIPGIKLARFGMANPKYQKAFAEFIKDADTDNWTDEQDRDNTNRFFVNFAVLDWRFWQPEDDGVNVPFSKDAAFEHLNSWEWVDLLNHLKQRAASLELFRAKELEAVAKN